MLRDSSKRMAARLAAAGIEHQLKVYPGMTHLFFGYTRTVAQSRACVADMAAFLRTHLPVTA